MARRSPAMAAAADHAEAGALRSSTARATAGADGVDAGHLRRAAVPVRPGVRAQGGRDHRGARGQDRRRHRRSQRAVCATRPRFARPKTLPTSWAQARGGRSGGARRQGGGGERSRSSAPGCEEDGPAGRGDGRGRSLHFKRRGPRPRRRCAASRADAAGAMVEKLPARQASSAPPGRARAGRARARRETVDGISATDPHIWEGARLWSP